MNKKDHTRKPVIRDPLPEKDWITLCELVIWRATGKARSAAVLRRFMRRHQGQRQATELRASFERAAATVVSLCRKGDLSPNGSVDGNPHEPFSKNYFLSDVYADPVSDSMSPDLLAWPRSGPYPDENPEEPRELPTYRSVRFLRSDLLSTFEQADQPAAETAQAPAGGAQDDAALALEMVSARGTDRLKPATSAVPPEPAIPAQAVASTAPVFIKKGVEQPDTEPPGTTAGGVGSTVERRTTGTFSEAKVRRWYAKRVKEWPPDQRPPSRDDDIREAKEEFSEAVTYRLISELRNKLAPKWTAKGRPPS